MKPLTLRSNNASIKAAQAEFDSLLKHPQSLVFIRLIILLLGISWLVFGLSLQYLPPQIPLLFSKPWGEEQLIPKLWLALSPGLATLFFIINSRLASMFIRKDSLLPQILLWAQLIITLFSTISVIRIVLILA